MSERAIGRQELSRLGHAIEERRKQKFGAESFPLDLSARDVIHLLYQTTGIRIDPPLFSLDPNDFPQRIVRAAGEEPEPKDELEYAAACAKLIAVLHEAWNKKGCIVDRIDDGNGPFKFSVRQGGSMFEFCEDVTVLDFVEGLPLGLSIAVLCSEAVNAYRQWPPMVGVDPAGPDPAHELERLGIALKDWP